MQTIKRESGIQITLPDDFEAPGTYNPPTVSPSTRRRNIRGAKVAIPMPGTPAPDPMVAAFQRQEMQLLDQVELKSGATTPGRRARAASSNTAEFSVPLAPNENAVLLLEQDGMYSWQIPEEPAAPGAATRGEARRMAVASQATFRVILSPTSRSAGGTPAARRGFIADFVRGKVMAYVFKFAARAGVDGLVKFLERNTRTGIVSINSADVRQWGFIDDLKSLALPDDRPARILLFIHGTFSSTIGGFGALTATPWGAKFLEGARANYDSVIGFDHPTLSVDPLANAIELLKRLEDRAWKFAPQVDIITHSRGGLVTRSLVEQLLPMSSLKPRIGRVIFVAATNGGTQLASAQNWKTLIDLYTNLAFGASKLLQLLPQAHLAGLILNETVQSLGALVKFAAAHALVDEGVPGLAAMRPDGSFVRQINETQQGQLSAQESFYFAVTSQFSPKLTGDHLPPELPLRLLQLLGSGFMGELMREANDLVVNTASMTTIDPHAGKFIKDSLDFTASPQVYHTNYFLQPKVADALTRWLGLVEPAPVAASPARIATRRSARAPRRAIAPAQHAAAPGSLAALAATRRMSLPGEASEIHIPAVVDTDILVADADALAAELRRTLKSRVVSNLVVRRLLEGELLNYAFKYEEALRKIPPKDNRKVLDALELHEYGQSVTRQISDQLTLPIFTSGSTTKNRLVVTANERPVGVVSETVEPLTNAQIAELTRKIARPGTLEERAEGRRAMPTFAVVEGVDALDLRFAAAAKDAIESASLVGNGPRRKLRAVRGGGSSFRFPIDAPPTPMPARTRKPVAKAKPSPVMAKTMCFFYAEMDQQVIVKRATTVDVTVSREEVERILGTAAAGGKSEVRVGRKIVVQAIPKRNFELIGDGVANIDLPPPGQPQQIYFDLKPTDLGEGEIWIVVRQGQAPLLTLKLRPQIVKTKDRSSGKTTASQSVAEATPLKSSLHQLDIYEIPRGGQDILFYVLDSPELGIYKSYESRPITGNLKQYINDLYAKIENRWLSTNQDAEDFTQEMRALGGDLFEQLFPHELQQVLWDNREKIRSIRVISTEPFVPWEMMHLKDPGRSLPAETRFLGQMGLVRWLNEPGFSPPERLLIREGRARYVIPNYPHPDLVLPEALREAEFLQSKFSATPVVPKSADVRNLLSQPGAFDLLHFACHGEADSNKIAEAQLLMEGRVENNQFVEDHLTETLVKGFANLKGQDNRPLIVLNACQTGRAGRKLAGMGGFAQAFLQGGAGAFVGALWSVGDSPARRFTESLYEQLCKGATLSDAAILAREQSRKAGDATWLAYIVYGHPHLRLHSMLTPIPA
jgi:hypothetical protein